MSIPEFLDKIKRFLSFDDTKALFSLIVIIVAIGSFFMGRFSVSTLDNKNILIVNESLQQAQSIQAFSEIQKKEIESSQVLNQKGLYVASKRGKLYYRVGCGGARKLAPANQIFFQTADEALRAGYQPSPQCTP